MQARRAPRLRGRDGVGPAPRTRAGDTLPIATVGLAIAAMAGGDVPIVALGVSGPCTWGVSRGAALDEIRRRNARPCQVCDDPARSPCLSGVAGSAPGPEELCVVGDRREGIVGALSRLPAAQRETIDLAYYSGLKQSEIAELQRVPLRRVKIRTRLALERLRSQLEM